MDTGLQSIPIPIFTFLLSLIACMLTLRVETGVRLSRNLLVGSFALIGFGALLVALRFGYGVDAAIGIQRSLPVFLGPLIYLVFATLSIDPKWRLKQLLLHFGLAIAIVTAVPQIASSWLNIDLAISLSYVTYMILILRLWFSGANKLQFARLEMIPSLRRWMLWSSAFLFAFFIADTAIAISFMLQKTDRALAWISYSSLMLVVIFVLFILMASSGKRSVPTKQNVTSPAPDEFAKTEAKARAFLIDSKLYFDTELTVDRLAKRLHMPARELSAAINQTKGMNVSQYVNGFRLDHAADLLVTSTQSVTKVMEQSGFLTRSNFYREFQKRFEQTPSEYRKQNQ